MVSGEWILSTVVYLLEYCLDILQTPLFTYKGVGISLWNFMIWLLGFSIVMDLFVVIMGGSPVDNEMDLEEFFEENNSYYD